MIATVTLNPCLDKSINVNGLVIDEANRWTSMRQDPGGKGIMASRAIHEMGGDTTAYGFIGGHDGRMVEILLDEEDVHCDFTPILSDTRTNFIITDIKTNQQTRIDAPGPRISKASLERLERKLREIHPQPDFMILAGSAPPGVPDDIYARLIGSAKSKGTKVILDSDGEWLKKGIEAKPYLIKPNVSEAERLLGVELSTEKAIIQAARRLAKMGIEIVVISRGRQGMIVAARDEVLKVASPELKAQSTVGAGDCTIAGFAIGLSRGETLTGTCRLACAMGTAAVLTPGTTPCRQDDVERLLPQIKVQEITSAPMPNKTTQTQHQEKEKAPEEVHLRRMRADDAMLKLDSYLNDAFLSGLHSVRIIHGKGEGILRHLVSEQLAAHPLVRSFRPAELSEGGGGVTIAELDNY